jgi:hypothetical protein
MGALHKNPDLHKYLPVCTKTLYSRRLIAQHAAPIAIASTTAKQITDAIVSRPRPAANAMNAMGIQSGDATIEAANNMSIEMPTRPD